VADTWCVAEEVEFDNQGTGGNQFTPGILQAVIEGKTWQIEKSSYGCFRIGVESMIYFLWIRALHHDDKKGGTCP